MYHFQNISILEQTALVSMQNRVIEQWQNGAETAFRETDVTVFSGYSKFTNQTSKSHGIYKNV